MIFDKLIYDENDKTLMQLYHSTTKSGKRSYREHHHTQFEISYFKSGSGIYKVGNKTYGFDKGDIFVFSSDEVHCITEISEKEKLNLINIHFEPRFIWSDNSESCDLLGIFFDRNEHFSNKIEKNNPHTLRITQLIDMIEDELTDKKTQYRQMVKMHISHILILLMREYGYVNNTFDYSTDTITALKKAMEYIDKNLESNIELSDIAKKSSMSRTYFSSVFKKYNGISPWDYITIKRVERAIEYIGNSDYTKTEIAGMCGFSSMSNFYRAFKKITGKAPNDYDKKSRK